MYRYLVADTCTVTRLVALRDSAGRYHVAHCTSVLPNVRTVLEGLAPAIGFALLTGLRGEVVRVIFCEVCCGPRRALALLHADGESVEPVGASVTVQQWCA
jgi:hypothetical protein